MGLNGLNNCERSELRSSNTFSLYYLAHVTYNNEYNLLLFYREIEIWVELMNEFDKSKVDI